MRVKIEIVMDTPTHPRKWFRGCLHNAMDSDYDSIKSLEFIELVDQEEKVYAQWLQVDPEIGDKLEKWTDMPPTDVGRGEVLFDQQVMFPNAYRLAVQAISSTEPDEPMWTQAVLFDKNGLEVGCTEVADSFYGEYQVDNYRVIVVPASS